MTEKLTLRKIGFNRAAFMAFLKDSPDYELCGYQCNCESCPLAEFVKSLGYTMLHVRNFVLAIYPEGEPKGFVFDLPKWARNFIALTDETPDPATQESYPGQLTFGHAQGLLKLA